MLIPNILFRHPSACFSFDKNRLIPCFKSKYKFLGGLGTENFKCENNFRFAINVKKASNNKCEFCDLSSFMNKICIFI